MKSRLVVLRKAIFCLIAFSLTMFSTLRADVEANEAINSEEVPRIIALLVGVDKYPMLAETYWLEGPSNDVSLFASTLESFGCLKEDITILNTSESGELSPTKPNILRELNDLREKANPGDQVVVFLAGHGSQQPAGDDFKAENDGLDEIFLPSDVVGWNSEIGAVENAISDDELGNALHSIRETGAHVWFVGDFCHSGTATRSGSERSRKLLPSDLGIPPSAYDISIISAMKQPQESTRGGTTSQPSKLTYVRQAGEIGLGDIVVMSASQEDEEAPESILPSEDDGKYHGLFTYTLVEIMRSIKGPITYRQLLQRISLRYRSLNRIGPTPLIEGTSMDTQVLGTSKWSGENRLVVVSRLSSDQWRLSGGAISGLSVGSLCSVYPPAGELSGENQVCMLEVVECELTRSRAKWIPVKEGDIAPELEIGSRCELVSADLSSMTIKLALQLDEGAEGFKTVSVSEVPIVLQETFEDLQHSYPGLVGFADHADESDWVLRWSTEKRTATLVPIGDTAFDQSSRLVRKYRIDFEEAKAGRLLGDALFRIARASNLIKLSAKANLAAANVQSRVAFSLTVSLHDYDNSVIQTIDATQPIELKVADRISFKIENIGKGKLDANLLYISSDYEIVSLFDGKSNRLSPGQSMETDIYEVSKDSLGPEQIVAIALRGNSVAPTDLSYLAQPRLDRARSTNSMDFRSVLEDSVFGASGVVSRGARSVPMNSYAMQLLPWTTQE